MSLFDRFFYKFYKKNFIKKNHQVAHSKYLTNIKDLRQLKLITAWNNHFDHIIKNNLRGDIVECGVGNAEALSYILFNLKYKKNLFLDQKSYFGFDSFKGFPEVHINDKSKRNPQKGDWDHSDENYVISNLKLLGFNDEDFYNINFIKGFFEDSFLKNKSLINQISLLHLDCDLYNSYKISLQFFYPKVVNNGIIVFDEYLDDQESFPGAAKAIKEFFGRKVENIQKCEISGKYFLIKS